MTDEQVFILVTHYYEDIEHLGYRYRVRPYTESQHYCILDDHTDQLYHHQRGGTKTRRVWTSLDLVEAINFAETLSKGEIKPLKEETSLTQKVAYINQGRKTRKASVPMVQVSPFSMCEKCQQMTKRGHECE
jgi:hypothetical protein